MKYKVPVILGFALATLSGCQDNQNTDMVVSKRYVHKYGYAVSQEEWEAHNYPGQVIASMRDGVTVTTTYEHGILHGPCTYTYPHSQTVEKYVLYKNGETVKEVYYDTNGVPSKEEVRLSPTRYTLTTWFSSGSPMSIEEISGSEIIEGQYFTTANETEARIDKGTGIRVRREQAGLLLFRDTIEKGQMVKRESFHPSGVPEFIAHFVNDKLQGEKRLFNEKGEPLAIEEWKEDKLHGLSTYFKNGLKTSEVSYLYGKKNGLERHYLDGETLSQEISWENDKRHGVSTYFVDGQVRTEWFYDGTLLSQKRYEELAELDEMILRISPDITLH